MELREIKNIEQFVKFDSDGIMFLDHCIIEDGEARPLTDKEYELVLYCSSMVIKENTNNADILKKIQSSWFEIEPIKKEWLNIMLPSFMEDLYKYYLPRPWKRKRNTTYMKEIIDEWKRRRRAKIM